MNKNNLLLLMICLGISFALTGCKKNRKEVVYVEEKRISGPLSDRDIEWTDADYK